MLSDRCLSCAVRPVCDVGVLWPNGWTDQDETWHAGRPRPGHIVLDRDPSPPPPKRHSPPIFGPCLLWPNGRPSEVLRTCIKRVSTWSTHWMWNVNLSTALWDNCFNCLPCDCIATTELINIALQIGFIVSLLQYWYYRTKHFSTTYKRTPHRIMSSYRRSAAKQRQYQ